MEWFYWLRICVSCYDYAHRDLKRATYVDHMVRHVAQCCAPKILRLRHGSYKLSELDFSFLSFWKEYDCTNTIFLLIMNQMEYTFRLIIKNKTVTSIILLFWYVMAINLFLSINILMIINLFLFIHIRKVAKIILFRQY